MYGMGVMGGVSGGAKKPSEYNMFIKSFMAKHKGEAKSSVLMKKGAMAWNASKGKKGVSKPKPKGKKSGVKGGCGVKGGFIWDLLS
jgi:hypothetical protein